MGVAYTNPKRHDQLFKWLITRFIDEFFELFFPRVKPQEIQFIDKEFLERLHAQKAAVTADLFLALKAQIDGQVFEIVIVLEFKNVKENVCPQLRQYYAHALSIQQHPVWSIVIFTDDQPWQMKGPLQIPIAYSYYEGFALMTIDVIKLRSLRAETLTKQHHLLAKLLALKAEIGDQQRAALVLAVYKARTMMKQGLPDDIDLLIEQFIRAYSGLSRKQLQAIKEEAQMIMIAPTITEHYQEMFKLEGKIDNLTQLLEMGKLTEEEYQALVKPVQEHLAILKSVESEELYQDHE